MNKLLHPFNVQLMFSLVSVLEVSHTTEGLRHLKSEVCRWPKYSTITIQVTAFSSNAFHTTPNGFR